MNRAEAVRTEEAREAESNGIDYGVICLREARLKQGPVFLNQLEPKPIEATKGHARWAITADSTTKILQGTELTI
jgi:hypothetical protein